MLLEAEPSLTVLEADNANQAMRALREQAPDIVMIALPLQAKTGLAVLEFVQSTYPGIPIIVLTSEASQEVRERCLRAGARFVFRKSGEFDLAIEAAVRLLKQGTEYVGNNSANNGRSR